MGNGGDRMKCHDITNFTIRDITECGMFLRRAGEGAESMEEAAGRIVRHLYDTLIEERTGERACSLVRFFKTHPFEALDNELKAFALSMLAGSPDFRDMKCLTLLATAGENPAWNSRLNSKGHKAIPLPSEEALREFPMILHLVKQLGLPTDMVLKPDPELILDMEQKTYNVFHVKEAPGSPCVLFQEEFVVPYGIKSVLGFGGLLPTGDIFAVIMFLKVPITRETADLFRSLSLSVKLAVLPFESKVFA
jgi:hypothetical protein